MRNTSNIENNNFEVFRRYVNGSLEHERTTNNISDDTKVFALIEKRTGENEVIRYQYDNHLGSSCLELDANANIISYEEYHPFGTTSYRAGRSYAETSLKRYKYCGKERDEETGLYYYGARYYAGWLYRFVSVDPLNEKYPELSAYQYASNRPITCIDLDGKEAWFRDDGSSGILELLEGISGPLSEILVKEIGATHYGLMDTQINYSFSDEEIQSFADWNKNMGSFEPGYCLGCAVTGSEILTDVDAGFRNSNGQNVLGGKNLYDLGENLEKMGNATELATSQGQEIASILNNPNINDTENTAYIAGPAGAYHSIIIVHNAETNMFSIYDQGTGWDVKDVSPEDAQNTINSINSIHPTWGARIWQLQKTERKETIYPYENKDDN